MGLGLGEGPVGRKDTRVTFYSDFLKKIKNVKKA